MATFQFLSVRLKGDPSSAFLPCTDISIPFGAIKSESLLEFIQTLSEFQFLSVRLKGYNHEINICDFE